MARLAFGAKCGRPGRPPTAGFSVFALRDCSGEQRKQGERAQAASAAAEELPPGFGNHSFILMDALQKIPLQLLLHQHFVQIHQLVRNHRHGRQFRRGQLGDRASIHPRSPASSHRSGADS